MIEHPVPQNITEYRFHLIGNMTVKQFLILLAGTGIAFLFYTTNLPGILKWFLMIVFFGAGAAAAFVPFEERTLDQWLINFIKAIYRPTKYFWRREPDMPSFFNYVPHRSSQQDKIEQTDQWLPNRQQQIQSYLSSLQSNQTMAPDPLDVFTNQNQQINDLFDQVAAASNIAPGETQKELLKPDLQVRARPLRKNAQTQNGNPQAAAVHSSDTSGHEQTKTKPVNQSTVPNAETKPHTTDRDVQRGTIQVAPMSTSKNSPQDKEIDNHTQPRQNGPSQKQSYLTADDTTSSSQSSQTVQPAVFDRDLPFPSLPNEPNVLVGMVHDPEEHIIPGAIIEILDENGNTVRAMKTNTLGQFYISSPLRDGTYHLETESSNYKFPVYELHVSGETLDPVDIKALAPSTSPEEKNKEPNLASTQPTSTDQLPKPQAPTT